MTKLPEPRVFLDLCSKITDRVARSRSGRSQVLAVINYGDGDEELAVVIVALQTAALAARIVNNGDSLEELSRSRSPRRIRRSNKSRARRNH